MERNIDIFISHHSDSSKGLVVKVANILEELGHACWYAERDIMGSRNYTEEIPVAIRKCKMFLLLLNKHANASDEVLREIQLAVNKMPILIIRLDDCELRNSIQYVASVSQMISIMGLNSEMTVQRICEAICSMLEKTDDNKCDQEKEDVFRSSRSENDLEFYGDFGERKRLELQHFFVTKFAESTYDSILEKYEDGSFLDIGCNTGEQSRIFLRNHPNMKYYIGVDKEEASLMQGRTLYPQGHFYQIDCESNEIDERLSEIEEELGIDGFDIINLSMVILHTKEPHILLDVLESHLAEDGCVIILDIDDGFNVAYPDPNGNFKKAVDLCFETAYSGFRHSGRQIYKLLHDVELEDICLHKMGMSTVGMTRKEKEEFYDIVGSNQ
jgi:SAM-dependent methyltransferase